MRGKLLSRIQCSFMALVTESWASSANQYGLLHLSASTCSSQ